MFRRSTSSRSRLWRLGMFLELPFDARVPDGATVTVEDGEPLEGWGATALRPLPSVSSAPPQPLRPLTGFHFRRATLRSEPFAALAETFPFVSPEQSGVPTAAASSSVVQATRLDVAPDGGQAAKDEWVSDRFDGLLACLNDFLVLLGQAAQDAHIRPVDRLELPAVVPFLLNEVRGGADHEAGELHLFVVHPSVPHEAETLPPARLEHAMTLLGLHRSEGHPFFPFAEALLAARSALLHGRTRQAALDAGSAVELLVNTVLREVAPLRGYSEAKAANVVANLGLKNQLVEHLAVVLRCEVVLYDEGNAFGRWYCGAYALRNRVSHEGYRPSHVEAQAALDDVEALVSTIGRALAADELTEPLASRLLADAP